MLTTLVLWIFIIILLLFQKDNLTPYFLQENDQMVNSQRCENTPV